MARGSGSGFVAVAERKAGKDCIHLDLTSTSIDDQADSVRGCSAGARHADIGQDPDDAHVVLADPEGNELCIIEPSNSFLAGCDAWVDHVRRYSRGGLLLECPLGWPLVWDQDEETAVRAPDGTGPSSRGGPPIPPAPARNRLRLEVEPATSGGAQAELDRLVSLGASRLDGGLGRVDRALMADPDGNEFWLLSAPTERAR